MAKRQQRRRDTRRAEHARTSATRRRVLTGVGLSLGASLVTGATAHAATFEVDRSDDTGTVSACTVAPDDCNLRGAFAASNASSSTYGDYIVFNSSVTGVTLTAGEIDITDAVYVYGNGANATTISGGNNSRIFYAHPGTSGGVVNFNYLTLTGGNAGSNDGGAIYNLDANLNIYGSVLTGNSAGDGGAIYDKGAYYNGYNTDVIGTTISQNTASDDGGGFYAYESAGQVFNSTISGNAASNYGGGIYMFSDSYLYDATIAGNSAARGGGIFADSGVHLLSNIVADNTAPAGPDVDGSANAGFSLLESLTGTALTSYPAGSNIAGQDPQLGPLQINGGSNPTPTRRPAATSPVDARRAVKALACCSANWTR